MKRIWKLVQDNAAYIGFFLIYTAAFILFVRTLFITIPLILGVLLSMIAHPVCRFLERKLRLRPKTAAYTAVIGCYIIFLTGGFLLLYWLCREAVQLASGNLYFHYEELSQPVREAIESFMDSVPMAAEKLTDGLSDHISALLPAAGSAMKFFLSIPALLLVPVMTLIAACLLLQNKKKLQDAAEAIVGSARLHQLQRAIRGQSKNSGGFAVSYLLIYFITFCEAGIIFYILGMPYPLITAVITAVSDIFPILGPGAVFLPLCIYRLLCGSYVQALGLLAGWLLISVIRQIIEPRLVSKLTRTPAIVMLAAVYLSFIYGNFWIIPYTALFFFLRQMLQDAGFPIRFRLR